jgi:hypothetical protein
MSSPPRPIKKSPKQRQSPGSGHHGLPKTPRQGYTQTPNLGTSAIYRNNPSIIIEKYREIQKMLADYKEELEKYKRNSEDVDYDSLLRDYNSIKAKLKEFDTTYREEYESMTNPDKLLQLGEDKKRRELGFPERIFLQLEKFGEPEEPEKRSIFHRLRQCCSCRNKFKSKSKKGKKSGKKDKKGKKSKKTQKSK